MVRNWDTVRAILLKLEAVETAHTTLTLDQVDGIAPQEVGYHMMGFPRIPGHYPKHSLAFSN